MERADGMSYITTEALPRTIPNGCVLAHNHVWHTIDMTPGRNGFRAWTWPRGKKPRHFMRCNCGWAGLLHYADSSHAITYRCESEARIASYEASSD